MKKRILTVLLAMLMIVPAGCTPPGPGPGPDPAPPFSGEEGKGPEEGKDPEEGRDPEGGELDPGPQPGTVTELPDADLLAFSVDRLENADLSFNFTIGGAEAAMCALDVPVPLSDGKEEWEPFIPTENDHFTGTPDTMRTTTQDFFESSRDSVDLAHESAEGIRDTVLQTVNVMNKFVHIGAYHYLLNYIPETDTLHVYDVTDTSDGSETYDLLIYPDADGDETAEYWYVNSDEREGRNSDQVEHLIYSAGKRYYYENILVHPDPALGGESVYDGFITEMYRKGDGWRGYQFSSLSTKAPFCSHSGSYELGAGPSILFYTQSEDGILMETAGNVSAYDGITGEKKVPADVYAGTDEFRFEVETLNIGNYHTYGGEVYANNGRDLVGWGSVDLDFRDVGLPGDPHMYEVYTLHLANGKTFRPDDCIWKEGYGIVEYTELSYEEQAEKGYQYVGTDGQGREVHFTDWDELVTDSVRIEMKATFDRDDPITGLSLRFLPDFGRGYDDARKLELIKECWTDLGLSVRQGCDAPSDVIGAILATDLQGIAEEIMLDVYNGALGLDGMREVCIKTCEECDETIGRLHSLLGEYEIVEVEDMPARPDDFGPVGISGKIKGQAAVTAEGIDYSAVTLDVEKTVIFTKGSQYALYVAWDSFAQAVTEPVSYAGEAFTLKGIKLSFPDLPVGTHVAKLFLGKVLTGGCARISEAISVPVSAFETVTKEGDEEKGLRKMTEFTCEEGLTARAMLVDLEAPKLFVDGAAAAGTPYELTYEAEEGKTVSDLFDKLTVTDNSVGTMSARSGQFSRDGIAVFAGDALVSGTYVYTIADGSGNSASVTFTVTVNKPEPEPDSGSGEIGPAA